jgi:hypothetical protein
MSRSRGGFTLVLVHGGGSRMVHVTCPRWLLRGIVLTVFTFVALLMGTWWDYFSLKRAQNQAASVERRVDAQRVMLDSVEQRVADLNREVGGWQAAHARVWSTFGPGPGGPAKGAGTGGAGMGGAMAVLPLVAGLLAALVAYGRWRLAPLRGPSSRSALGQDA